jgi:hypothetical protein
MGRVSESPIPNHHLDMLAAMDMGDPFEELRLPPTMPLTPRSRGRGLPVPPVLPLIAVLSVLAGLAMGYGLAPKPGPNEPSSHPSETSPVAISFTTPSADSDLVPTARPAATPEIPPPGGLSLAQALDALNVSFGSPVAVISARVGHFPPVSAGWVWLIVLPYSTVVCQAPADPPMFCRWTTTTELVVLDYKTGEFLEDRIPSA